MSQQSITRSMYNVVENDFGVTVHVYTDIDTLSIVNADGTYTYSRDELEFVTGNKSRWSDASTQAVFSNADNIKSVTHSQTLGTEQFQISIVFDDGSEATFKTQ